MSSEKRILQINPELFKFNGSKKSLKGHKERKSKPIQDKNQSVKSNKLKKELLKKVKDYQKNKEVEKIKEEKTRDKDLNSDSSNLFGSNDFEDTNFEREFNKSLTFLHDLSKKNKEKKKHKTLKTSNLDVHIDIPKDSLIYNKEPNYGCLKHGSKPTFRDLNKTQKHNIDNTHNNGKKLQITLENNTYYDHDEFHKKYQEEEKQDLKRNYEEEEKQDSKQIDTAIDIKADYKRNCEEEKSVIIPNFSNHNSLNENSLNENSLKENFIDIINSKKETIDNLDKENSEVNSQANSQENSQAQSIRNSNNEEHNIPKLRRTTKTYKYKLGKKKDKRYIGLLIKNRETQKRIKQEVSQLKQQDIQTIKNYLREKNLIKLGSQAPNDVLRKLYEDSILSGDITNINNNNLVYNYLHD